MTDQTARSGHAIWHRVSVLVFFLVCVAPLAAQSGGQHPFVFSYADSAPDWMWRRYEPTGCFASIPESRMHNTPVYLDADMMPVTDSMFTLQAGLMAQDVASELRALLDSAHSVMPNADGKLPWYSLPAQIVVTVHADGSESWRAKSAEGDSSAVLVLGAAFDSAQAHGKAMIFRPEGARQDSMLVRLSLSPRYTGPEGQNPPLATRGVKFGVFYLREPDVTPAVPKRDWRPPRYPAENESNRVEGDVLMQFVVDSTGRTDPNSFRELWPADKPRLSGYAADQHDAFVSSARVWEKTLTFYPMLVGGCPVKQQVMLPLKFVAPFSR
jgi:hypothetical protein